MKSQLSNIALEDTCNGDVVGGLLLWTGENLQALLFLKEGTMSNQPNRNTGQGKMNRLADRIQNDFNKLEMFVSFIDGGCDDDLILPFSPRIGMGKILSEIVSDLCDIEDEIRRRFPDHAKSEAES